MAIQNTQKINESISRAVGSNQQSNNYRHLRGYTSRDSKVIIAFGSIAGAVALASEVIITLFGKSVGPEEKEVRRNNKRHGR